MCPSVSKNNYRILQVFESVCQGRNIPRLRSERAGSQNGLEQYHGHPDMRLRSEMHALRSTKSFEMSNYGHAGPRQLTVFEHFP